MLRENLCITMATNYYSSSAITSVYANPDTICNTPLPPITTVTEKLYYPVVKNGDKPNGNQSLVSALDGSVLSDIDFNSHGGNLAEKICSGDQATEKVYAEAGNLAELDSSFLLYQNADKFNFQNIDSEFQSSGNDFYMNGYGAEHQVHQLPHLLPQMELIPSSVAHSHQSCVQQSWSSRIQQQLIQGEEEADNVGDSEQLQQQLLLQQQALQLNQLFSQQLDQEDQQTHAVPDDLQQFQLLNTSHQQQQQHVQQQSQQLSQQTQHLQQLYHDQGLLYDSSLPSTEGMALPSMENGNILSNEAYCADALANFLLKTEFQTSACLSGSVSSTTRPSFPTARQTGRSAQQCCSTTTLDLLEAIRLESKGLKFNEGKTDSSVEGDHTSPNHDLPSSTTDGCSGSSVGGKTGSGEGHGGSKVRVTDKEELNTKEIASRVNAELKKYSIPQAIFAERVLGRSQGTLSDLLRNPKPWSKLKSGRETFRRMRRWLDEPEHSRMVQLRVLSGDATDGSAIRSSGQDEGNSFEMNSGNSPFIPNDPLPPIPLTTVPTSSSSSSSSATPGKGRAAQRTPKKPRMVFTEIQRRTLVAIFKEIKRPSKEIQATIADQLGLKMSTVVNFFMNARRRSIDKYTDDAATAAASIADDCPGSSAVSSTGSLYDATA